MRVKNVIAWLVVAVLLCGGAVAGEEKDEQPVNALRLIEVLEKAGLKVSVADVDNEDDGRASDDAACREMLEKLERSEISVSYEGVSLGEVLADLQKISGVNLLLDPKVEKTRGEIEVTLKLDKVKPASVLGNLLRLFDLVAVCGSEALIVALPSSEEAVTLVYDVHELTEVRNFPFPGNRLMKGMTARRDRWAYLDEDEDEDEESDSEPMYSDEELTDLLREATPQGRWDAVAYSITYANGLLIVTQRLGVHIQVANIISALKTRGFSQ